MSLQDKIFDVGAALEGKPESDDFDAIMKVFNENESELNHYKGLIFRLREGAAALKHIIEKDHP
jgi:hypothetical protein